MGRLSPPTAPLDRVEHRLEIVRRRPACDAGTSFRHRPALVLAVTATVFSVLTVELFWGPPAPAMEPELRRLLHGMVTIKGLLGLAAAAVAFWRLGGPIARPVAVGYITTVCVALGAVVWLWGLWAIPLGSLLFWSGLTGILLVARRDRWIGEMARRGVRSWVD